MDRIQQLKLARERAQAALARVQTQHSLPDEVPPALIEAFGQLMRQQINSGEVPLRRAYLRAVIDQIKVDKDEVRIMGNTARLERAVASSDKNLPLGGVQPFERKWRPLGESNPCRRRERAVS